MLEWLSIPQITRFAAIPSKKTSGFENQITTPNRNNESIILRNPPGKNKCPRQNAQKKHCFLEIMVVSCR